MPTYSWPCHTRLACLNTFGCAHLLMFRRTVHVPPPGQTSVPLVLTGMLLPGWRHTSPCCPLPLRRWPRQARPVWPQFCPQVYGYVAECPLNAPLPFCRCPPQARACGRSSGWHPLRTGTAPGRRPERCVLKLVVLLVGDCLESFVRSSGWHPLRARTAPGRRLGRCMLLLVNGVVE